MKRQYGFTLVEVVIVVVILAILAAIALPRYMKVEKEARAATVKALASTIRAASEMVHGVAIAMRVNWRTVPGSITAEDGVSADIITSGDVKYYPVANSTGIVRAIVDNASGFGKDYTSLNVVKFNPQGTGNFASCQVSYIYDGNNAPIIEVNTSDCSYFSKLMSE